MSLKNAAACAALMLGLAPAAAAPPSLPPQPKPYWHVWVDTSGLTHQTRCAIKDFSSLSLGKDVQAFYVDKLKPEAKAVWIAQLPKGWVGQWHENPNPQWVIPLSGRWFVETNDGTRVEMGPGDASFGEDQAAKPDKAGHKGHLSGTVGDAPVTLMFVIVPMAPRTDDACWLR